MRHAAPGARRALPGRAPRAARHPLLAILFASAALAAGGCGNTIYKDYPVYLDDGGAGGSASGKASIVPGVYDEQLFKPIKDGDTVHIINGFQGGTWVHVSIRVTGMPPAGTVFASLGKAIGETTYNIRLVRTAEGFREAYDIPIPIHKRGAELTRLYGSKATLTVSFTAKGKTVTATRSVVLAKG